MKFKNFFLIIFCAIFWGCSGRKNISDFQEVIGQHYIAHAGGTIQGFRYSNCLEAVSEALMHDFLYIELDLCLTADSQLVAWHDWNWQWTFTPTYEQFMSHKVYDRFTPIDFKKIDSIMANNPNLSLVTDKISDPAIIDHYFHSYKQRVWVECFTDDDYFALQQMGYHVLASKDPPTNYSPIGNYTFNRYSCSNPSIRYGACFAIYGGDISCTMADSIFAIDERIRFVYVDNYNK